MKGCFKNCRRLTVRGDIVRRYAAIDIMSVMENLADTDREAEFMVQIPETAFISNFTMLINDELFIAEIKGTGNFCFIFYCDKNN